MKIIKNQFVAIVLGLLVFTACQKKEEDKVEIKTIDFEDLSLGNGTFWNGSDGTGEFSLPAINFKNNYNVTYNSWDGFAFSRDADIVTATSDNQYSVFDAENSTNKFVLYYRPYIGDAFASFATDAEYAVKSISVCNSTYTALTIKNGSSFSKKFGGETGNDKDWFKMTAISYNVAGDSLKSVDFYLADYRFDDNSKDFIVNKWTTLDLSSFGKINKMTFRFTSSDNGDWGINTPTYVCLDNLKYEVVTQK